MQYLRQSDLFNVIDYNKDTGDFIWKRAAGNVKKGDSAGGYSEGYLKININKICYSAHRLAWLYVYGEFPKDQIDHINRVRSDNRIINLRNCTNKENRANSGKNKKNSSGYKGVSWHKATGKWQSQIAKDGVNVCLGFFDSKTAAAKKYNDKALELNGKYAFQNKLRGIELCSS